MHAWIILGHWVGVELDWHTAMHVLRHSESTCTGTYISAYPGSFNLRKQNLLLNLGVWGTSNHARFTRSVRGRNVVNGMLRQS